MWNTRLDEAQAGIKIAGRNINNLRYADDTTLMVEKEEELKRLLMKVKEESEAELDYKESWEPKNWCFLTVGGDSWESLRLQGYQTSQF